MSDLIPSRNMTWLENLGLLGLFLGTFLSATVVPFSSDALYLAILHISGLPMECLLIGTAGNWLGGVTTYFLGRLASWEWVEKTFRIKQDSLEKQRARIEKYGVWTALLTWVPFIGDVIAILLGFYRSPAVPALLLMLIGKFGRFAIWTLTIFI